MTQVEFILADLTNGRSVESLGWEFAQEDIDAALVIFEADSWNCGGEIPGCEDGCYCE